jgi:hypothetical protein
MTQISTITADALDAIDSTTDQARAVLALILESSAPVDRAALHCLARLLDSVADDVQRLQLDPDLAGDVAPAAALAHEVVRRAQRR